MRSGGTLRSPVGPLAIAEVVAELDAREEGAVYRIRFQLGGPDPRDELAADDDLPAEAVADLRRRLDRKDREDPRGPWTRRLLELIGGHPNVIASWPRCSGGNGTSSSVTSASSSRSV